MTTELHHGDCIDIMRTLPENSVDSIVTDPPYGLGFMGKKWDALPPGEEWAREALRVLKPGGHLLAFGGTRTWHRLAVAVEDAGFEIRDSIAWLYSEGFPKAQNLKPAFEPAVVARKPFTGPAAANIATHGTGHLSIDACRIPTADTLGRAKGGWGNAAVGADNYGNFNSIGVTVEGGRWPANVTFDASQADILGDPRKYFYVAKAPKRERPVVDGVAHATVKPLTLMRHLVKLVTPAGGTVLEPFAGSGTTVEACILEGFNCIAIEREAEYLPLIHARIERSTEKQVARVS